MAWARQPGAPAMEGDGVFDEERDERDVRLCEWRGLMARREKEGYLAGLEEGKESALQDGFNQGFGRAVGKAFHTWQLSGALRALELWNNQNVGASDATREEIQAVQTALSELGQILITCVGAEFDGIMDADDLGDALESMDIRHAESNVNCPTAMDSGFVSLSQTQNMDANSEQNKNECDSVDCCKNQAASINNCTHIRSVGWNELQMKLQQLRKRCAALLGQAGLTQDNIALILCEHIVN